MACIEKNGKHVSRYDSIIIGAGHNGLVCAAYLARSGQSVLVLEASDKVGGLAANREFHPGFQVSPAHTVSHFSAKIAAELDLASHGYTASQVPVPSVGLSVDQKHVTVHQGNVTGGHKEDADAYRSYLQAMQRYARALEPFWLKTMPRIGSKSLADIKTFAHIGLNVRRIGKKDMRELLRVASLPARDLMDEHFDNGVLKAMLSWDGLIGAKLAPRSPNSAVLAMLYRMTGAHAGAHSVPSGGVNGLVQALRGAALASGVTVRCGALVERIQIGANESGLVANGVVLDSGESLEAERVVSATDPKQTLLNLVGVEHLDIGFTNRIRRLRCDGYVAKLHLALEGLPEFAGIERPDGRMIIAPDMDAIEFAFDDAKYGDCPANPVMEIVIPTVHDASLAPTGKHVLSAHVMYVPHQLKGGWTDAARDQICDRAIDTISRYAPAIRKQIIHQEFLTPADLQKAFRLTGGHWHHAEIAMDQMLMMRPTYEAAQYSTPIPGLFLCSAGCHPGGDITGAAGHNAAHEILR